MTSLKSWLVAAVGVVCLVAAGPLYADGWGDIKGQIVFSGPVPAKKEIKVDKDVAHCMEKGTLIDDSVIVDSKTMGVKNVMIWLAPVSPTGKMPIHPDLAAVPKEKVVIDQPHCMFVPRITMMREGQELEVKNLASVLHNARITGSPTGNGTINLTIPPGNSIIKQPKAERRPMLLGCDIHNWMGGRIGVFNHPYFALSKEDGSFEIKKAPAGTFKIFIQHEKASWLQKGQNGSGQEIEIKPNGVLDLGKFVMKAE